MSLGTSHLKVFVMESNTLVGLVLIAAGFIDAALALFVVGPKVQDPTGRMVAVGVVLTGAVAMVIFGGLLAYGTMDLLGS